MQQTCSCLFSEFKKNYFQFIQSMKYIYQQLVRSADNEGMRVVLV